MGVVGSRRAEQQVLFQAFSYYMPCQVAVETQLHILPPSSFLLHLHLLPCPTHLLSWGNETLAVSNICYITYICCSFQNRAVMEAGMTWQPQVFLLPSREEEGIIYLTFHRGRS